MPYRTLFLLSVVICFLPNFPTLAAAGPENDREIASEFRRGVIEVPAPFLRIVPQLGFGIFDAWVTKNSFLLGPGYGYRPIGGLTFDFLVSDDIAVSTGGLYVPRRIGINQGGTVVTMTRNTLLIPLIAKYSLLPLFSIIGGGYYGVALGDWDYDPLNPTDTANIVAWDVGFVLGAEVRLPVAYTKNYLLEIVLQMSYLWGFNNMARDAVEDFRYREYHFTAGFSVGI